MRLKLISLLGIALLATACGGDSEERKTETSIEDIKKPENQGVRARNGNLERGGMGVTSKDLNNDGTPDQWTLSGAGGGVERVERDLNFDGKTDLWQYPDESGLVLEEEMDLDHDARVDVVVYYRPDGSIERKELAIEFSNKFTVYKYYDEAGELQRIEQDEDANSVIDRWDYYQNKRIVRTGYDDDGDGLPDRFEKVE